jgi:hypothetical protein
MASASTSDHHPMPMQATRNGATAMLLGSSCGPTNAMTAEVAADRCTFASLNALKSTELIDQAWRGATAHSAFKVRAMALPSGPGSFG